MIKRLILIIISTAILSGCYDQTDIENLKNVSIICVDNSNIYFCCVTSKKDDNKYSYDLYTVNTDDLYYGIDNISKITGKVISLSHVEAIIFSDQCDYNHIKKTVNSLLEGTNTHPKIMTAFYNGNFKDFFETVKVPSDISISKFMDKILLNNNIVIPMCSAMELSCALNFDIPGYLVPLISINNGNIEVGESYFVNNKGINLINKTVTGITALINTKKGNAYIYWNNNYVPVEIENVRHIADKSNVNILIDLKDEKQKMIFDYYENEIYKLNREGLDLLGAENYLNKDFIDVKSKKEYFNKSKKEWISSVKFDVEVY